MLNWACKLAAAILALSVLASPLMACMVPGETFTESERECCRHMAEHCGSAMMPDSHSCCKVTVRHSDSYLANSRFNAGIAYSVTTHVTGMDVWAPATFSQAQLFMQAHSPPESPPETLSILRI